MAAETWLMVNTFIGIDIVTLSSRHGDTRDGQYAVTIGYHRFGCHTPWRRHVSRTYADAITSYRYYRHTSHYHGYSNGHCWQAIVTMALATLLVYANCFHGLSTTYALFDTRQSGVVVGSSFTTVGSLQQHICRTRQIHNIIGACREHWSAPAWSLLRVN